MKTSITIYEEFEEITVYSPTISDKELRKKQERCPHYSLKCSLCSKYSDLIDVRDLALQDAIDVIYKNRDLKVDEMISLLADLKRSHKLKCGV